MAGMDEYFVSLMVTVAVRVFLVPFFDVAFTVTTVVPAEPLLGEMFNQVASDLADQVPSAVTVNVPVEPFAFLMDKDVGLADRLYFSCCTVNTLFKEPKSSQTTVTVPVRRDVAGALS